MGCQHFRGIVSGKVGDRLSECRQTVGIEYERPARFQNHPGVVPCELLVAKARAEDKGGEAIVFQPFRQRIRINDRTLHDGGEMRRLRHDRAGWRRNRHQPRPCPQSCHGRHARSTRRDQGTGKDDQMPAGVFVARGSDLSAGRAVDRRIVDKHRIVARDQTGRYADVGHFQFTAEIAAWQQNMAGLQRRESHCALRPEARTCRQARIARQAGWKIDREDRDLRELDTLDQLRYLI